MSNFRELGWSIRLIVLTVGGSMSVMAIALVATSTYLPMREAIARLSPNTDLNHQDHPHPNTTPGLPSTPFNKPLYPWDQNVGATPDLSPQPWMPTQPFLLNGRGNGRREAIAESYPPSSSPATPPQRDSTPEAIAESLTLPVPLTLRDVVILALENNRTIKNAYLDRLIQQENLAVAENRFNPNVIPRLGLGAQRDDQGLSTATGVDAEVGAEMEVLLPTGTRFTVAWQTDGTTQNTIGQNAGNTSQIGQQISIQVAHPLWRNAGQAINRAPIHLARLQDEQDRFSLQTTLMETITIAIQRYYDLVLAQQQLIIQEAGLARTEGELTRIEALITAGRLPAIQRVEAQADVANRQVDVLAAANTLRDAQQTLIQVLDIERSAMPKATEMGGLEADKIQFAPDDELVNYGLVHNPDYRSRLLNLEIAAIELLQAEDALQWDLDLVLAYSNTLDSRVAERSDVRAGIQLSRELGDRTLKQRVIQKRTQIQQLENMRIEDRDNLEIDIRNALRNVAFQQTQVQQAQRATQLAEQQLENTQVQFRQGRRSTFLDIIQSQDNLVDAQNRELSAQIGYQNALANLDQQLGHTLETWNIQIHTIDERQP